MADVDSKTVFRLRSRPPMPERLEVHVERPIAMAYDPISRDLYIVDVNPEMSRVIAGGNILKYNIDRRSTEKYKLPTCKAKIPLVRM